MTDSLKERLAEIIGDAGCYFPNELRELIEEALARIEELEAESQENWQKYVDANEALIDAQATIAKLEAKLNGPPPLEQEVIHLDGQIKTLLAENRTLQGKLDRVREGLEKVAAWDVRLDGFADLCELQEMASAVLSDTAGIA